VWDLQRNGNNVQLTTERILGGRGLETVRFPLRSSLFPLPLLENR